DDLRAYAVKSLERVLSELRTADGSLWNVAGEDHSRIPASLGDHVWLSEALIQAFQTTGEPRYLRTARALMDQALRAFWDPESGGFFDHAPDVSAGAGKSASVKTVADGHTPAPNAIAALVLDRLTELSNVEAYRQKADELLKALAPTVGQGELAASYA